MWVKNLTFVFQHSIHLWLVASKKSHFLSSPIVREFGEKALALLFDEDIEGYVGVSRELKLIT